MAFKDLARIPLHVSDFARTVELIIDFLIELERRATKGTFSQSLKVVTDAPLTLVTVMTSIVLPMIVKVSQKDHQ
jgi:hypothetical protein